MADVFGPNIQLYSAQHSSHLTKWQSMAKRALHISLRMALQLLRSGAKRS